MLDAAVPVVLGGSVLAAREPRLVAGVVAGLAERAPAVHVVWVREPPVVGAALLALEAAGARPGARARGSRGGRVEVLILPDADAVARAAADRIVAVRGQAPAVATFHGSGSFRDAPRSEASRDGVS